MFCIHIHFSTFLFSACKRSGSFTNEVYDVLESKRFGISKSPLNKFWYPGAEAFLRNIIIIIIVLRCAVLEYNSHKKAKGNLITSHYVDQ